jgi:LemA protein
MGIASLTAIAVASLLLVVALVRLYNGLIARRNAADNAFSTIDVQLKMRCDLVPRVVDAARGYMEHERGVLEELTRLRAEATAPGVTTAMRVALDEQMGGLLSRVFAVAEQYPDLKASNAVIMLQRTLNEVEAQLAAARRTYNAAVTEYNTHLESFPTNLAAGAFGFSRRSLFEAGAADRESVNVALGR